jgi:hypothetical protein
MQERHFCSPFLYSYFSCLPYYSSFTLRHSATNSFCQSAFLAQISRFLEVRRVTVKEISINVAFRGSSGTAAARALIAITEVPILGGANVA